MQRPKEIVITSAGTSDPYVLDRYVNGYGITVVCSASDYTLQYSNSDPYFDILAQGIPGNPGRYTVSYNASGKWLNWDDTLMVNASVSRSTNMAFPARAIRIKVSSNVSTANPVILQIVPMGMDAN